MSKPTAYLLDTNAASAVIKQNSPVLNTRLLQVKPSQLFISVITEAELLFGLAKKPQATQLHTAVNSFLAKVQVRPWDRPAAATYATLRAKLERAGKPLGNLDMLIAAQALSQNAVLISNDQAFRQVDGLRLEDWMTQGAFR